MIKEYLTISPCKCGSPYCHFFGSGIGENGKSFSRKSIELLIEDLKNSNEVIEYLEGLISKSDDAT